MGRNIGLQGHNRCIVAAQYNTVIMPTPTRDDVVVFIILYTRLQ